MALKLTQNGTGKAWSSSKKDDEEKKTAGATTAPARDTWTSGKLTLTKEKREVTPIIQQPKEEERGVMDLAADYLSGWAKRQAAGHAGTAESLLEGTRRADMLNSSEYRRAQQERENAAHYREMIQRGTMDDGTVIDDERRKWLEDAAARAEKRAGVYDAGNDAIHKPISGLIEQTETFGDRMERESEQQISRVKEETGVVGDVLLDAGLALGDVLADAAGNMILPGLGTAGRVSRTYGSGAERAEEKGFDLGKQALYGAAAAAIGEGTNRIFSSNPILKKATGSGALDDLILPGLEKSLPGSIVKSGLGEALEEGTENIVDYFAQKAILGDKADTFSWKDVGYDALIGGLVGGVTGVSRQKSSEQGSETTVSGKTTSQDDAGAREKISEGSGNPLTENASEGHLNAISEVLAKGGRVDQARLSPEQFDALAEREDIGMDSSGRVFQVDPAKHISQRTYENAGNRSVNAFQFDHPELQEYYKVAAQQLVDDAALSLDAPKTTYTKRGSQGKQRVTEILDTPSLRSAMEMGLTRNDIIQAAQDLIADNGQENHAAAKRLEFVLDEMLTNGYTTARGESVEPNTQYISVKESIPGYQPRVAEELPIWDMDEGAALEQQAVQNAYEAGKAGVPLGKVSLATEEQEDAYMEGRRAAILSGPVEKAEQSEYTEDINKEGVNDGTERVHLREGSKRDDSADSQGSVRKLEKGTGRDQSRNVQRGPADGEAAGLAHGKKVSTAELGIRGGSKMDGVFLVDSQSTEATKAAQKIADERGLKLVLFAGHDLHTAAAPEGARGYTDGKTLYVRVDDPDFTAEQIALHEVGHDMIAKGEIDLDVVRERIAEAVGQENLETAAGYYAQAYAGTGMTPQDIWEECVCDVLGGMNIFADVGYGVGEFMETFLSESWDTVENSKQAPRGPPANIAETGKNSWVIGGKVYGRERTEEARRAAFKADRVLHWTKTTEGRREAPERLVQFRARMGRSGATVRSRDGYTWAYLGVANHRAGAYAKEAAKELRKLGAKGCFIYDGEIQWNHAGKTYGSNSYAVTLESGEIGINNSTGLADDVAPPAELAAHETIHRKVSAKTKEGIAYRKAVIANAKITHPMFKRYFALINHGYHNGLLNFDNVEDRIEFFREFVAYVGGYAYAGNVDVSPMFEDYGAVCEALEKVLGAKIANKGGGKYSRRASVAEMQKRLNEMNAEYQRLGWKEREYKASREYNRFMDDLARDDIRAAAREAYAAMLEEYGSIEAGEKPARDVKVPKRTSDDQKVSQTVRTILEAQATPDEALPNIEQMVATGDFSYDVYTDKAAIADATGTIKKVGWVQALSDWTAQVKRGEVSKVNTAMGWALYNNAVNSGDTVTALDILDHMVKHQRNAAQAVQATRILKKLSPETQLYHVQRSVDGLQEELNKRYGKKGAPELKIDQELAERYMKAQDQTERDEVLKDIYRDIGRQMPSTFRDKWNAWRYLAMLGNPRTHVRNVAGNLFFAPVVAVKNLTATGIEVAVSRVSGGKLERSKSMVSISKGDRALLQAAWNDFPNVQETALSGGKYSEFANANKYIEEGRQVFKTKALEKARKGNSRLLDREDLWFSRPHYAAAMASYCKQHGLTAEQIRCGKETKNARAYAIREAQKATYRDTTALSHLLSARFDESGEFGTAGKVGNMVVEGVLPFRKTPANILARGIEYSPFGLLNGIKQGLLDVRKGTKTGAEAIDSISAGLTGTGLLALGLYMAAQGLVRGHGSGDDNEKEYKELQGHQAYSLEVDGKSYTLDWLAPEALPFFVGVNLWEQGKMEDGEMPTMADWQEAIYHISEPLLEMSCLQSLNDMIDSVSYSKDSGLIDIASSIATSYITQAFPTLFGQIERIGEDLRYTTYTEANSFLTGDQQYTLGKISGKTPGEFQQIPYIDAWGRTESTGTAAERAVNNLVNPAYVSQIEGSAMEEELLRLYEATGEAGVLPSRAAKYFNVGGARKDLTAEEYVKYATKKGQTSYSLLAKMTKTSAYKAMDDAEKAEAVAKVYEYANAVAKAAVSNYKPEGWVAKAIKTGKDTGIKLEQYVPLYLAQSGVESLKDADGEAVENSRGLLVMQLIYNTTGLTEAQRKALFEDFGVGKKVQHYNRARVDQQLERMRKKAK